MTMPAGSVQSKEKDQIAKEADRTITALVILMLSLHKRTNQDSREDNRRSDDCPEPFWYHPLYLQDAAVPRISDWAVIVSLNNVIYVNRTYIRTSRAGIKSVMIRMVIASQIKKG